MQTVSNDISKRALQLLRETRNQILKAPKAYNQGESGGEEKTGERPTCKSPACILGWMVHLRAKKFKDPKKAVAHLYYNDMSVDDDVCKFVGLTRLQARSLFTIYNWPQQFLTDLGGTYRNWERITAESAAKRIDHFIETGQ